MPSNTTIRISAFTRRVINKDKALENTNRVIKANKNLFLFFSKGDETQRFNGNFKSIDGEGIWCRQLAAAFALRKKLNIQNYHDAFQSPNNIPFLYENHYDHKNIAYTADSYYLINLKSFGDSLYTLSKTLKLGKSKHMLLLSETHAMAISLEHHEKKGLIAKFYDPNTTTTHQQIWFSDTDSIKKLKVSELLSQIAINSYFVNFNGVLVINPETENTNKNTQYEAAPDASWKDMLHFGLSFGISSWVRTALTTAFKDNANPDTETLMVKNEKGYPGLYIALQNNHEQAVSVYMDFILNSNLNNDKKIRLLSANNLNNAPGLFIALQKGNTKTVETYINSVLNTNFNTVQKIKLLAAKNKNNLPGLFIAFKKGHNKTVEIYMTAILNANLDNLQKVNLLAAKNKRQKSGVLLALEKKHTDVVKIYREIILQSTLAPEQKADLLRPLPQEKQTLKRKYMPDKQQAPPRKIPRPNF